MRLPIGPEVDATPRPAPARVPLRGQYVLLEPIDPAHIDELWQAAQGADESWTYLPYGPFATREAMLRQVAAAAADQSRVTWTVRPLHTGVASGWLSLMDIQPKNAAIELGGIWFSPAMQRTRASTEAMFLPLRLAADDLGYRRLVWKCNSLNMPSRRAAERLGFTFEGTHRMHMMVKGRDRDSDWYSIIAPEWPSCRDALHAWLAPHNFTADGRPKQSLATLRH